MNKRFIVLVDDATPDEQNTVTEHFRASPYGFWHRFSDGWLITDRTGENKVTAAGLRDELKRLVPGKTTLVVQMDNPTGWAGFGQTEAFQWLNEVWNAP